MDPAEHLRRPDQGSRYERVRRWFRDTRDWMRICCVEGPLAI